MKQTKSRGDMSGFQPVSWDEALGELGKKLGKLRAEGKSHEVACITSNRPSSMDDLWLQFFTAYGSPNLFRMPSAADGLRLAAELTTGKASPFAFSLGNAEYILSFGANLFEGAGATSLVFAAMRQWTRETPVKLVQVESRCSATASKADRFLAVAPGTEAMLAMGIAHLMVSSGSYDADFVKNNVFGFEDWTDSTGKKHQGFKSLVTSAAYSPEEVAKSTGLEAAKIREVAKEFAARPKAVAVWAIGQPDSHERRLSPTRIHSPECSQGQPEAQRAGEPHSCGSARKPSGGTEGQRVRNHAGAARSGQIRASAVSAKRPLRVSRQRLHRTEISDRDTSGP